MEGNKEKVAATQQDGVDEPEVLLVNADMLGDSFSDETRSKGIKNIFSSFFVVKILYSVY